MKHLGDITKIKGCEAPVVDCIIGGSPCQDLSVAGKRAGLAGERSGLYMEQIRIIKEMRHRDELRGRTGESIRPRYMVWENVPGAFSSNGGKDFAAVIEEAVRVAEPEAPNVPVPEKGWPTSGCIMGDNWSVAWRVLDAQFWGVPQRRRRICLVADWGGLNAPKIVFGEAEHNGSTERAGGKPSVGYPGEKSRSKVQPFTKGVSRDFDESKSARKATARDARENIGGADHNGPQGDGVNENVSFTLNATDRHAVVYGIGSYHSNAMKSDNPHSGVYEADTSRTLDALNCGYPGCNQGGMAVVQPVVDQHILDDQGGSQISVRNDGKCPTLRAETHGNLPCVMEPVPYNGANITSPTNVTNPQPGDPCHTLSTDERNYVIVPNVAHTLRAKANCDFREDYETYVVCGVDCRNATEYEEQTGALQASACNNMNSNNVVRVRYIVRRLTPLECERLQGYPDGWTDIGEWVDSKGKKHKEADSPRYKALGNSIALPPWKWVLKRLCACYERDATMASLFDGIGGFPYIWEQLNGKGSCLWASEIEEFPMAVTKLRFGG